MPIVLFLASKSDQEFAVPIRRTLEEFGVKNETVIASAHKVPEKALAIVEELNMRKNPTVVITCVGRSNGLSGVIAGSCIHPVVACPVFKDKNDYIINIHSTLQMPSDVPVLTILDPVNAALAALRILAESDAGLRKKLEDRMRKVKASY